MDINNYLDVLKADAAAIGCRGDRGNKGRRRKALRICGEIIANDRHDALLGPPRSRGSNCASMRRTLPQTWAA